MSSGRPNSSFLMTPHIIHGRASVDTVTREFREKVKDQEELGEGEEKEIISRNEGVTPSPPPLKLLDH